VTQTQHRTRQGAAVTAVSAILIAFATLRPDYSHSGVSFVSCLICGQRGIADAIVNVILFAPLGVGLTLLGLPRRRALLLGALGSCSVELLQIVIPGRDPSIYDVLCNSLGVGAGIAVVLLIPILAGLKAPRSAWFSLAASLCPPFAVVLTGTLVSPSFPHTMYWGQWTPDFEALEWYRGRVVSARIGDREIPPTRIADSEWVRQALIANKPIDVEVIAGPPVEGLAPIFSIADQYRRGIVLVGADIDDLVFRYSTGAAFFRLDQPYVRLVGGMNGIEPGSRITLRVSSPKWGWYCLEGPRGSACDLGFSVGDGWGLLYYPEGLPEWMRCVLRMLWVAALVAPIGFLARNRLPSYAALALVGFSLQVVPALVGLRSLRWYEWLGALLGLVVARMASRSINGRTSPARADAGSAATAEV
jgi:VanZ like family